MSDRFRLVTIDQRTGKPSVVDDLNAGDLVRKRDTFRFVPPARRERAVAGDVRYQGGRVVGVAHDNAQVATGLLIKADTAAAAAGRVEALLEAADRVAARDDLYIEWAPAGLRPVFFPVRGPGTVAHAYGQRAFEQARAHELEVSWPVAPLAEGLPLDVIETFANLDEWTVDTNGGHALAPEDVTATWRPAGFVATANAQTIIRHTGRGYPVHDALIAAKIKPPDTNAASLIVRVGRHIGPDKIAAQWVETGASRSFQLAWFDSTMPGWSTLVLSAAPPTAIGSRAYWVALRQVGRYARAELWDRDPQLGGVAESGGSLTATAWTYVGTTAQLRALSDSPGDAFIGFQAPDQTARLIEARVLPYTFDLPKGPASRIARSVPGNAPAKVEAVVGAGAVLTNGAPFGLLAWRQHKPRNMIVGADAEAGREGWYSTTIAGGLTAGGNATPRDTDGGPYPLAPTSRRYDVLIDAIATANTGGAYRSWQRVRRGAVHTVEVWYFVDSGSWEMDIRGDGTTSLDENGASIVTALSGGAVWRKLTKTFVAAADRTRLEVIFRVNSAVAGQMAVGPLRIYAGTTPPTDPGETDDRGAFAPFGVIFAEGDLLTRRSGFTAAAGIGPTGRALGLTGAGTAIAEYAIDPDLIAIDDESTGELDIEVWGYGHLDSGAVNPRVTISHAPLYGPGARIYSRDYGSAGKPLGNQPTTSGNARTFRLGTLTFVRDGRARGRRALRLQFDVAAGGAFTSGFAYLVLVPQRARAATPSGKVNDSTYPAFFAPQAAGYPVKRIGHDGRGYLEPGGPSSVHRDSGLGGAPLELAPGDNEVLAWVQSGAVPDDPVRVAGSIGAEDLDPFGLHLRVTPRYRLWRDD